jgi:hypothetical protein
MKLKGGKGMNTRRKMAGEPNPEMVWIHFLTPDEEALNVKAMVRLREGEMVVDIPDQPSSGPYLVFGKKVDHFFAGVDSLAHEEKIHVVARWALLGDVYVGIWIEEGTEHLFSFRVPRSRVTTRAYRRTPT